MLVAMALLMMLMLLLVQVSNGVMHYWHHAEQRQEACREGHAALEMIVGDLRSAVMDTALLFSERGTRLFFLANLPREKRAAQDRGDCCMVGYFLDTEKSHSGIERQHLYRFYASCDETMEALAHGTLQELCKKASPTDHIHCERVASNILAFQVMPLWSDHGNISTNSSIMGEKKDLPPTLVELCITATPGMTITQLTQKIGAAKKRSLSNKEQTFTTVVTLPVSNKVSTARDVEFFQKTEK